MATILLLNGPNLNLLGKREPALYGETTLAEVEAAARQKAAALGIELTCYQSNHEAALIDAVHAAFDNGVDAIVVNPGGLAHTSIILRDALVGVGLPFVEVHITNIYRREPFRRNSYLSDVASGVICGFGVQGYDFAIDYAASLVCRAKT